MQDNGGQFIDLGAMPEPLRSKLVEYMESQGEATGAWRRMEIPYRPWPDESNPMIEYLFNVGHNKLEQLGIDPSDENLRDLMMFLVIHAWFEGALCEHAAVIADIERRPPGELKPLVRT